ncbi:MAG TPA: hypothetical protein VIE12_00065 [Actinomycetota bacterium]|jgi:hypothetical protein
MEGIAGERRPSMVVGEGDPARRGLLRFVLEGEGFDVVGEATTTVQLVQVLAVHRPEAVILDDGIGTTAVVVAREMHPDAKVILVWPSDVIPIGGDARVDPADVLRELGPAVERVLGLDVPEPAGASVLALPISSDDDRSAMAHHPSVSAPLARVLPGPGLPRTARDEPIIVDREPAPLLILPVPQTADEDP